MKLQVICDNETAVEGFKPAWGFACMIGEDLLFDTGESDAILFHNLEQAGVNPENLKMVVVSHGDGDHTGGLVALMERNPSIKVVLHTVFPPDIITHIRNCGADLTWPETFTELSDGIFTTGPYPTREQALVIRSKAGLVVVTGCAHPDIVEILRNIHDNMEGPIDLVFGGFHLLDQSKDETLKTIEAFRGFGVRRAGACHCTGPKAIQIFREQYADDFLEIGAGTVIEIDT